MRRTSVVLSALASVALLASAGCQDQRADAGRAAAGSAAPDRAQAAGAGGAAAGIAPAGIAPSAGGIAAEPRATRAQCEAVRDHLARLLAEHYRTHPDETWDGLDRSDPQIREGLPPEMSKENFATFLASDAGRAWLDRQRARAIAGPPLVEAVERCVAGATNAHVRCWLEAASVQVLLACPSPS